MKVKDAIAALTVLSEDTEYAEFKPTIDAIKLGIAALERHQNRDYTTYAGMHEPLPGETSNDEPG